MKYIKILYTEGTLVEEYEGTTEEITEMRKIIEADEECSSENLFNTVADANSFVQNLDFKMLDDFYLISDFDLDYGYETYNVETGEIEFVSELVQDIAIIARLQQNIKEEEEKLENLIIGIAEDKIDVRAIRSQEEYIATLLDLIEVVKERINIRIFEKPEDPYNLQ